jgi:SAM-dependent methyltransferase
MEKIRQYHNDVKRELILRCVQAGTSVLDVGCGFGGDLHKWVSSGIRTLDMCDPSTEALAEAKSRASKIKGLDPVMYHGDILSCPSNKKYDVVCYNFSLHYIFENEKTLEESLKAIKVSLKPGGILMGITPEKARAESMADESGNFRDKLGNEFKVMSDRLLVRLTDGPFYANGAKEEPLLDGRVLIERLKALGFNRLVWEPMVPRPTGLISDLYTKFVFVNGS